MLKTITLVYLPAVREYSRILNIFFRRVLQELYSVEITYLDRTPVNCYFTYRLYLRIVNSNFRSSSDVG